MGTSRPHIITAVTNPNITPPLNHMHWINTATKQVWYSVGTGNISDWILQTNSVAILANLAAFPLTGNSALIYLAEDSGILYRWNGTAYVAISVGVTDHTLLSNIGTMTHLQLESAIAGKEAIGVAAGLVNAHAGNTNNPHSVTKTQVGLSNVDNTSDANKPISTATQTALNLKADITYVDTEIDAAIASAYKFIADYNATTNTPDLTTAPNSIKIGHTYVVSVAGSFFGENVEIGDQLICKFDSPSTLANWSRVQKNVDNAAIKTMYESNANTNAFTDAEKTKLSTVEQRANHTGEQAISTVTGLQTALDNKIGTDLNSANIIVGNASNLAAKVAMSGDVTLSNLGAATIANGAVTNVKVAAGIDAVKIADGTVSNTEFQALNGIETNIQERFNRIDSTGLKYGGEVTYNSTTTFDVAAGHGHIVDHSTNPPTITFVEWNAQANIAATLIGSGQFTRIEVNNLGIISQSNAVQSDSDRLNKIQIGILVHDNLTTISNVFSAPNPDYSVVGNLRDLAESIGTIIKSGCVYSPNGANLNLNRSGGSGFVWGRAYGTNKNFPSNIPISAGTALSFYRVYRNNVGGYVYNPSQTLIDPNYYDTAGATLTAVPTNKWQIQYVYFYPEHSNTYVVYGQNVYNSKSDAIAEIGRESTIHDTRFARAALRAFIVVKQGATTANDLNQAVFYSGGKFGSVSPSGSAISTVTDLQSAYNASVDPEIVLDNTKINAGLSIRNSTTPVSGAMLEVTSNDGSVKYLEVLATGVKANTTASRVLISNASSIIESSNVTTTTLNFLDATSSVQGQLNGKEPTLVAGTTLQYYRGDKSWQTLNTSVVPEVTNLYFTDARVRAAVLTGFVTDANSTVLNTDTVLSAMQKIQGQINARESSSNKGIAGGYASLDGSGLVPTSQLPSFVDDVLEYANLATFPVTGETGKIYVALNTNKTYRWSGSVYVYITSGAVDSVFGRGGIVTAQTNDYTWAQINKATSSLADITTRSHTVLSDIGTNSHATIDLHLASSANPHGVSKSQVGLGNADNTSDLNKPISTATQTALDLKVTGAASSTDNAIARFDGATGKIIQNSTAIIDDSGNVGFGSPTIAARLHVKGSGSTSATKAFKVDNSSNTSLFEIDDTGIINPSTSTVLGGNGTNHEILKLGEKTGKQRFFSFQDGTNIQWRTNIQGDDTTRDISGNPSYALSLDSRSGGLGFQIYRWPPTTGAAVRLLRLDQNYFALSESGSALINFHIDQSNGNAMFGLNSGTPSAITSARLHVKGSGSTSATNAFRVDNSSNTQNFTVRDDGVVSIGSGFPAWSTSVHSLAMGSFSTPTNNVFGLYGSSRAIIVAGGQPGSALNGILTIKAVHGARSTTNENTASVARMQMSCTSGAATTGGYITFDVFKESGTIGQMLSVRGEGIIIGDKSYNGTATNTLFIGNGTAPDGNVVDSFSLYSADRGGTAGKAAPHIRNEDGTIHVLGDLVGINQSAPTASVHVTGKGATSATTSLLVENSSGTDNFIVRDDGAYAFSGGTIGLAQTGYTTFTNLVADRTCDANAATLEELADILGTLIEDLKLKGIIKA